MDMREQLEQIRAEAEAAMENAASLQELDAVRVKYLGKKGELTAVLKTMGKLSPEERPKVGQMANEVREVITAGIDRRNELLKAAQQELKLKNETIDVTLPGTKVEIGHRHPLSIVLDEVKEIFLGMGFEVVGGPEVEWDYYNFEAMIAPGRVFRSDAVDATHSPLFHQIEGMAIDEGITMGDLKGTLETFAKKLYGEQTKIRLRPHHFPFTEPSCEIDVSCFKCGGCGCSMCKGEGWIEILGGGMVHPKVLRTGGIDPDKYSGFAFGVGLERIAMFRFGLDDMRLLYENDVRFLDQF